MSKQKRGTEKRGLSGKSGLNRKKGQDGCVCKTSVYAVRRRTEGISETKAVGGRSKKGAASPWKSKNAPTHTRIKKGSEI